MNADLALELVIAFCAEQEALTGYLPEEIRVSPDIYQALAAGHPRQPLTIENVRLFADGSLDGETVEIA